MKKKAITNFECSPFDFDAEMSDDENNPDHMVLKSWQCPSCHTIHHNNTFHDFSKMKEEDLQLVMIDNGLDDLTYIIRCVTCKNLFKLDLEASSQQQIIAFQLHIEKRR